MRWKIAVMGLALAVAGVVGCKQQCFLSEWDFQHYHDHLGLPPGLDCQPANVLTPITGDVPAPSTVLSPEREIHNLTLTEAIAMALEHGTVGIQNPLNPGLGNDTLAAGGPQFGRFVTLGDDSIRVLSLDPAIAGADIEGSLAKFDARFTTSMIWNTTDRPVGTSLDQFQSNGHNSINLDDATFSAGIVKPLATGGVAGITFNTVYELSNLAPPVNPSYRPTLQFGFEQPLLQGFGVEINELRATHPGVAQGGVSQLNPFNTGGRVEGVLLTRVRFDISRAEFERNVHFMLLNVENAYWNLYGAYWTLYSNEAALRQAYEAWKINKARFDAGRIAIQDFAQTRGQYELFRGQRIQSLGQVLESERQLRSLLGLPIEDGTRLVPVDTPTLTPYQPDWYAAEHDALTLKPELVMVREELKGRQMDIIAQKNLLLPDLRFSSLWDVNGIGNRLDGPNGALASLASNQFSNYAFGFIMNVPLGYRDAYAALRTARLNLARTYRAEQDQERKVISLLGLEYRHLFEFHEQFKAQRAQRLAAAEQLQARFKEFLAGRGTLDILLEAQRVWATALQQEYAAIVQYNNALAGFEWAKGTILQHDNVLISEGPLPQCAQVRAVEHERQRSLAFVLRERANPVVVPACCPEKGNPGLPILPAEGAASVPAALEGQKGLPPLPETLPLPSPTNARPPAPGTEPPPNAPGAASK